MATLAVLRKQAKEMGISASVIRGAEDADELQKIIEDHGAHDDGDGGSTATATSVRKSSARKSSSAKKSSASRKNSSVKRSTARKNSSASKSAPAKSRKSGTAKRRATAKSTNGYVAKGGRNTIGEINYDKTKGWNPREGSAPDRIMKALKRFKGDRTKVFNFLLDDIGDFVKPKRRNGVKFTKLERENMLAYRIARTEWDFAMRTNQHKKSANRVEYGTGGTGEGVWKPARKASSARKSASAASRKNSSTSKSRGTSKKTAAKRAPSRRNKTAAKRR
jgi:hypothetical protein